MVLLACGPMTHGGSQWILGNAHVAGIGVALYTEPGFDAEKILDLVEKARVNSLTLLGDAMRRPSRCPWQSRSGALPGRGHLPWAP